MPALIEQGGEGGGRAIAADCAPGQGGQGGRILGDGMHLAVFEELQAVFHPAQQDIIRPQCFGLRCRQNSSAGQQGQAGERVAVQHCRPAAGVDQLQALDQEFQVADAARPVFQIVLGRAAGGGDLAAGQGAQAPDRGGNLCGRARQPENF